MSVKLTQCVICNNKIENDFVDFDSSTHKYKCKICGNVYVTYDIIRFGLNQFTTVPSHIISGYTREITELGLEPRLIRSDNIDNLLSEVNIPSNTDERFDKILFYLKRKTSFSGEEIQINCMINYPIAYAKNRNEFEFLLNELDNLGLIKSRGYDDFYRTVFLTLKGWNKINESPQMGTKNNQVFVAMWLPKEIEEDYEEMNRIYQDGIFKAIKDGGYEPLRIDLVEHNDKICERIFVEIGKSAFVVADVTGQRGGVYFEAGCAIGLGKPVIWMCKEAEVNKIHFDTRQYNHILWKDENDLYEKLVLRIKETILK